MSINIYIYVMLVLMISADRRKGLWARNNEPVCIYISEIKDPFFKKKKEMNVSCSTIMAAAGIFL